MNNRAFGVEIECYAHEIIYEEYLDGYGEPDPVEGVRNFLSNNDLDDWAEIVGFDESLVSRVGGVEIRSPILQGLSGFKELENVMSLLKQNRFFVDETCGMHVHHNAPEFIDNPTLVIQLVRSWMENQRLIDNMVAKHRIDAEYCPSWGEEEYGMLLREDYDDIDRYSLNINSLYDHETIEIRQHEGTLDFEEAYAWITFGQKFIESVSNRQTPIPMMSDEELLLKRIKVQKRTNEFLTTKVRRNKRRN